MDAAPEPVPVDDHYHAAVGPVIDRRPDALMSQGLPAVLMRGGTSKGLFFHARDLPPPGHRSATS